MSTDVASAGGSAGGSGSGLGRIDVPGASIERVHRPSQPEDLAAIVAEHHARGEALLVCGGRTRLDQANRADKLAAALSLEALVGVDVFEPDEGVVHARAGTPLQLLRETVAAEGWELPLDAPGPHTTVGGTIAAAALGPRAHVFGRVADAVLGLELVGPDGTSTKCGGRVVKNVTGYDLAKLYTGSFGSLGVIAGAWLRLRPQPARRVVLSARVARDRATFERVRALARSATLRACVWSERADAAQAELVVELGGSEAAVDHDGARLTASLPFVAVADAAGAALRATADRVPAAPVGLDLIDRLRDARARAASAASLGLRVRVPATALAAVRDRIAELGMAVAVDVGIGALTARAESDMEPAVIQRLRESLAAAGGHAVVEWMPRGWHDSLEVFGAPATTLALAANLKLRFDPRRILNPGRFVPGT
jgi:glycolate oxidase FAD binding subunit